MKRPLQFGQDARIFPGTKVMVNGARARELAGLAGAPLATGSQQVKDEIGVVASGAHGSRNRVDKPCFARGGSTSQTPSLRSQSLIHARSYALPSPPTPTHLSWLGIWRSDVIKKNSSNQAPLELSSSILFHSHPIGILAKAHKTRRLYSGEQIDVELQQSVYALDSTTIDLCLNLFPWARFRSTKAAIKLHTLLDLRGPIPSFIEITDGRCHDVNALDVLVVEPGAFYVMDRGYLDFSRLHTLHQAGAYFVIRARKDLHFVRYVSQPIDPDTGLCSDHIGRLGGFYSRKDFPDKLRLVRFYDSVQDRRFCFLTNHLLLPALTICQLYKMRWQVELFFKWIKQHLRIKRFYGNSMNAVKTQVWIAVCVYVLVAILKKELQLPQSLHSILQILSVSTFEKVPLNQLLTTTLSENYETEDHNQLMLWDL